MSERKKTTPNKGILSSKNESICQKIAQLDFDLISQRAKALLSINDGLTQAAAAEASDLTIGQVRYLMVNFKKKGLNIFPEEILDSATESSQEKIVETAPVANKKTKKSNKKSDKKKKPAKKKKSSKKKNKNQKVKTKKKTVKKKKK